MKKVSISFGEELPRMATKVEHLQVALRAAFDGIVSEQSGARACGRGLGLTRSLGWSFWNFAFAPDIPSALRALPGDKGWGMIAAGLERRGCTPTRIQALKAAQQELRCELRSRAMHPTLLRSIAAGRIDTRAEVARMRAARRKGREAAATLYGVHCTAACSAMLAGPVDSEGVVDTVGIALFEGLARSRPGPDWPIFEGQLNYASPTLETAQLAESEIGWGVDHLCSAGTVGTALRQSERSCHLVSFVDTGLLATKGIRAAFAQRGIRSGRVTPTDAHTLVHPHMSMIVSVPTRVAVFDMLLHESIPMKADPSGALYGPPDPWPSPSAEHGMPYRLEAKRLPLEEEVEVPSTGAAPGGIVELRAPWRELLALAAADLGQPLDSFRRYRISVKDPPMHGRILMRWTA